MVGSLPPGFTLSGAGVLSGTTSQAGTYNFTVKALVGSCQGTKAYSLVIGAASSRSQPALRLQGNYDGDGPADPVLWSGKDGSWQIRRSCDGQVVQHRWGMTGDVPVAGDYDGDGKSDLAVFRRATRTWFIKRSSDGQSTIQVWGLGSDLPVAAGYDGNGQTDLAVWRGSEGVGYMLRFRDQQMRYTVWGTTGDLVMPNDYEGDGQADLTVWRPAEATWCLELGGDTQNSVLCTVRFGAVTG